MSEPLTEVWSGAVEFYRLVWDWVGHWTVLLGIVAIAFGIAVLTWQFREDRRRSRG